jgi:hypothetical protein
MASTATIYLREETEMLRHKRIQTEERVRLEIQRAMEQMRNWEEENKARQIPQPTLGVSTPPQTVPAGTQRQTDEGADPIKIRISSTSRCANSSVSRGRQLKTAMLLPLMDSSYTMRQRSSPSTFEDSLVKF